MKTNRQVSTLFAYHYLLRETEVVHMELRRAATTSLAYKSEKKVDFKGVSTPFMLPPPLRMQEQDGGVFMAF